MVMVRSNTVSIETRSNNLVEEMEPKNRDPNGVRFVENLDLNPQKKKYQCLN